MNKWLHYYNARRPAIPAAGYVSIANRYGAHYYISMGAYRRAMEKLRRKDPDARIAFRGENDMVGEQIGVITYSMTGDGQCVPELTIIGKVEGVY